MQSRIPPPAAPGDEVAVLAPSAQVSTRAVEIGVRRLQEQFQLSPSCYRSVTADERLSPAERATEIHEAFESNATAVFAVAGGDDQLRLLQHLDLERLQANPTRFFGISDNTNLHLALSAADLVSYYGCQFVPGIACDPSLPEYTEQCLRWALFEQAPREVTPADEWTDDYYDFETDVPREWELNPGWGWEFPSTEIATGPVWGGCVVVIEHFLAVNRFVPDIDDAEGFVLALETSELLPSTYTVKSVLRCLGERGLLEVAEAVIVGRPKTRHKEPRTSEERHQYRREQREAIRETCRSYNPEMPLLFGLDFGHTDPQIPIPIGGTITLDPMSKSITVDHTA